jgi:hypothetical protein
MVTMEPSLRPYSAEKVELSTLNSPVVLMEGWKVIWFWSMSLRLMPLIWKLTESSRGWGHYAARREYRQIEKVAAVERQVMHFGGVDDLADGDGLGLDLRGRAAFHLHRRSSGLEGQLEIQGLALGHQ